MKLIKHVALLSLSLMFGLGTVQAETNGKPNNAKQTSQKSANQHKKQEKSSQKTEKKSKKAVADKALNAFNNALKIKLVGRSIQTNEAGQPLFVASYEIENKSQQDIKSAHWIAAYTHNNEIILVQDLPVDFEPALKAKTKLTVNLPISFSQISPQAQQILLNPQNAIGVVNGAKGLVFSNGKKIEIK